MNPTKPISPDHAYAMVETIASRYADRGWPLLVGPTIESLIAWGYTREQADQAVDLYYENHQ